MTNLSELIDLYLYLSTCRLVISHNLSFFLLAKGLWVFPSLSTPALPSSVSPAARSAEQREEYEFGHTLRFPRAVKAYREDKAETDDRRG